LAQSHITYRTTGVGQITLAEPVGFDLVFTEPPSVQYGVELEQIPDQAWWQQPRTAGGVAQWVTDDQGFYVGCYPYFTVDVPPQPVAPNVSAGQLLAYRRLLSEHPPVVIVVHHLMFRTDAYKRLPTHVEEALSSWF